MSSFYDTVRRTGFRRGPERVLGGVSAGVAHSLHANVALIRVLVLLAFLLPGVGIGLYLVAWLLLPWQDGSIPLERFTSR